jgi:hypothetical protein
MKVIPTFLLCIASLSCKAPLPAPPPPSQAELEDDQRIQANQQHATRLLASGAIHAGQDLQDLLKLCQPCRIDFVGRYTFIEFDTIPNLAGLSIIAIDDKLVSARRWTCVTNDILFETIDPQERQLAYDVYEARLFPTQR